MFIRTLLKKVDLVEETGNVCQFLQCVSENSATCVQLKTIHVVISLLICSRSGEL